MQPIILSILITWFAATAVTVTVFMVADRGHGRDIERLHDAYAKVLTAKGNVELYGTPNPAPAETTEREPLDREVAEAVATTNMIDNGINHLRDVYASIGVAATDDELRDEVLSILSHPGNTRFAIPQLAEAALAGTH